MYEYRARVKSVHDGDTFRADIDLGFGVWMSDQVFRLVGINAWELSDPRGAASRSALQALMPVGSEVLMKTQKDGKEKYGRWLATVTVGSGDVANALVAGGHAAVWNGKGAKPV